MSNEGSLLRLFKSEYFSLNLLLYYLQRRTEPGVHAYLVNMLHTVDLVQVEFYLPQLLNLTLHRPDSAGLERFFQLAAAKRHSFALKLYWYLQAAEADGLSSQSNQLEHLIQDIEMIVVNGQKPEKLPFTEVPPRLLEIDIPEEEPELSNRKAFRAEYFGFQQKFGTTLCKLSIALTPQPEDLRLAILQTCVTNINMWLDDTRHRFNAANSHSLYAQRLFRGVHLPFNFKIGEPGRCEQVLRILPEESFCFKTKARVPYKITFETIEVDEADPISDREAEPTETTEALSPELIGALPYAEEVVENYEEAKFAGFQEYVAEAQIHPTEEAAGPELTRVQSEVEWVDPWGEPFVECKERLRKASPFGRYSSWKLRMMIVKGHDDLRQELLAMQFIGSVYEIFRNANLKLWLQPYEIMIISNNAGLIEFVPDTQSLDGIKKNCRRYTSLLGFFKECWGADFEEAQKNFVESMAGYSLICYLLNIKDRHNGNILLDRHGHILHIDFGFMLTNSPGNMGFESAPFKLTMEMLEVMGGYEGELFHYYKVLLFQGFIELRKHADNLVLLVEMMYPGEKLPCFTDRERVLGELKERFMLNKTEDTCLASVDALVSSAAGNWRTNKYDSFQRLTNGIV
mmetsp:Transcript_7578/g.14181  ORF Transcript_7578/g.14181 Transcript_7578/m.14181 type:complete len:629 (+) Transcript_7578:1252-3138(+)